MHPILLTSPQAYRHFPHCSLALEEHNLLWLQLAFGMDDPLALLVAGGAATMTWAAM